MFLGQSNQESDVSKSSSKKTQWETSRARGRSIHLPICSVWSFLFGTDRLTAARAAPASRVPPSFLYLYFPFLPLLPSSLLSLPLSPSVSSPSSDRSPQVVRSFSSCVFFPRFSFQFLIILDLQLHLQIQLHPIAPPATSECIL